MSNSAKTAGTGGKTKLAIIIACAVVSVAVCITVCVMAMQSNKEPADATANMLVQYDNTASVILDQESLQDAVDEAMKNAQDGQVALEYKNDAYSSDGKTFSCYIVNARQNAYDMFLTLYADTEMTDQIYLSGLVPPGSGFEEITLDRELEKGDHLVYVAVTQVATEDNIQVIKNQVAHTIEFHVT